MSGISLKLKERKNLRIFYHFYKLYIKSFFSSPISVFLGMIIVTFTLFMWLLFREGDPFILASAIGAMVARVAMQLFHRNLVLQKANGFTTIMNFTPVNPLLRMSASIVANLTICLGMGFVMIMATIAIFPEQREIVAGVNWTMFLSAVFLLWFLVILMAITIDMFFKNAMKGMILIITMYIFVYNLLGCAYPYQIIANYSWLNIMLYTFPPRYMMNVMQAGWVNAKNLVYNDPEFSVDWKLKGNLALPYIVTFACIILLLTILIMVIIIKAKYHKKDGYGSSVILKLSTKYIRDIKRSTSFEEIQNLRKEHLEKLGYRFDDEIEVKASIKKKKIKKGRK
ncbi:hypothetical protein SCHIN_v1c08980 [Spiroplasma chinense]|uniref:Uncharacterized protein n=1 Tax=Spiroplasma chinense TaxID=216932 RepID=A0A5B9Y5L4_9MOLU|nr:hypothetical protein [Spiroplasma chinense]QEH62093.1 hypothetical protein SCHIN_v1c08980 [Spiroplasma chinense]